MEAPARTAPSPLSRRWLRLSHPFTCVSLSQPGPLQPHEGMTVPSPGAETQKRVHAGRLSRCWPQGQAPGQGHLCPSLCGRALVRSVNEEPAGAAWARASGAGVGLCQRSRGALVPGAQGAVGDQTGHHRPGTELGGQAAPLGIWPRASTGQLPGVGSHPLPTPRIPAGGRASHPQSSQSSRHAQSIALRRPQAPPTRPPAPASGGCARTSENVRLLLVGFQDMGQ